VSENARVAVVGVGNNTSALVQGISLYRKTGSLTGIRSPEISGLGVDAIDIVAAFAISDDKVGQDLHDAIFVPPNNFPRLDVELPPSGVAVQRGLVDTAEAERIADARRRGAALLSAERQAGYGSRLR
jgi:myo-inositol-1-phosphate synthase